MRFDVRKRKSWLENSGVSEVVGNILILMITVILFTGIIAFVNQIPVPEQATKADFDASISFSASGAQANLTVTHAGGASIKAKNVLIMVEQDTVNKVYYLVNDTDFSAALWSMGVSWYKVLTGTTYTSKIVVTVYDMEKDTAIWSSQVTGGSGGNPPSILQRYVDSNPMTPTADYVREYHNFTFYVKIVDNDNDLDTSNVWLDSSQIEGDEGLHRAPDNITGDGWFLWDFVVWNMTGDEGTLRYDASDLDGAILFIHASDLAGHTSVSTFVMSVVILPTDVNLYPAPNPQEQQGEYGLPAYLHFDSEGQGWAVFGEDVVNETANTSDRRTTFEFGEKAYIRVGSTVMKNIMGENKMVVVDTRTKNEYWPPSVAADAFHAIAGASGAAIYEGSIDTAQLIPGSFTVKVSLKSKATGTDPEVRFQADITIAVYQTGNPAGAFVPQIFLYKDAARVVPWGTKDSAYSLIGDTYKIYASVNVQDTQTSPSPDVEEIRIMDLRGGSEIYGVPPAGSMITAMSRDNATYYKFEIDLRYNNGDMWIGGRNAYTIFISAFSDSNEGVYSLSHQVFITAAYGRSDFILGTSGVASGNGNFMVLDYLLFVENNNFFTRRTMWGYENSPSNTPDYMVTALAAGDIDNDGDKDVLMGQKTSNALYLFKNSLTLNGEWQNLGTISRPSNDTAYIIKWIAFGDIDADGDQDFAYASSDNKIVIYENTYGMTPKVYKKFTVDVRKIDLKDMTGDGRADLIVLAGGKIYVYDLKYWGLSTSLIARLPDTDTAFSGGSGIRDFDIEDMNQDGMLDILTVGDAGTAGTSDVRGVWVNNYTSNPTPTQRKCDSSFAPLNRAGQIVSGGVTQTWKKDGQYLRMRENLTAVGDTTPPYGWFQVTLKTNLTTTQLDQILYMWAKVTGGSEVFYAWFSTDSTNGKDGTFTPMFAISGDDRNYSFRLPSTAVNKRLFIRFTDSHNSSTDSSAENLWIDYISIHTGAFGGYATSRYQVAPSTAGYVCVRGANIDGKSDGHLETVVAKNGEWKAYEFTSAIPGWSVTGIASFYVEISGKETEFSGIAPTLFDVVDVNGDLFSDILVCNYTSDSDFVSQVGFFLNLYPDRLWYKVKDLIEGLEDGYGRIVVALATNVYSSG